MSLEAPTPTPLGSGQMFDGIAAKYDFVNRVISLGIDQSWRRRTVRALALGPGSRVLDLATGTGDSALLVANAEPSARVVGLDPSAKMLEIARIKVEKAGLLSRVDLVQGDAETLPFPDATFDGVCIAFGIRNVPDRERALREMARVIRPGGHVAILELSEPRRGILGPLARFHVHTVVPYVGALLSGAPEYRYLQRSIAAFPPAEEFASRMQQAGFNVEPPQALTFGVCHLYVGQRPGGRMSASVERSTFAARVPSLERFRLALEENAVEAIRQGGTTVLALPAPVAPIEALLTGTENDAIAWSAPSGFELSALGTAELVEASGAARFRQVAERGRELLARVRTLGLLGATAFAPRLFGGFSFAARAPSSALWRPFGEARFVLPEIAYAVDGGEARLMVTIGADALARGAARDSLFDTALRSFQAIERGLEVGPAAASAEAPKNERPAAEWAALVDAIRAEIEQGSLEKVVLARRVVVELGRAPDPALVLARLRQQAPECTRFLVRAAGTTFLGATPEWLAKKHGATLETEAVAGSMSALDREGAARLLESGKDCAEHAFVVREIVRALSPLSSNVEHGEKPELYELRHVLHLRSRIRATLRGSPHLLHVVEQLHPTPAVGGVPTARALEWISSHEPDERGWYAGPVGWFDAAGDGELAVALRSGVLEGKRAHLYVGAGIVDRSSPAAEFTETRWKLAALLGALGVKE